MEISEESVGVSFGRVISASDALSSAPSSRQPSPPSTPTSEAPIPSDDVFLSPESSIPPKASSKRKQPAMSEENDTKKEKLKRSKSEKQAFPRTHISKTMTLENCVHYYSRPHGFEEKEFKFPQEPVKKWPFKLDQFQEESIACINQKESVLVSAHTSAGKTVVAEYAIALALAEKSRVIYTAPIKALSNQKYRELKDEFKDVGLMTGDVNIAPSAGCLVMTTEILRNMMLRGNEIMTEVSWIIFDEVHYMRDRDRGVVWEESIILIPNNINIVFLSATLSNPSEFCDWVVNLKQRPCHCVTTNYRPTPLAHYVFSLGGQGLYLVVDEKGNFKEDNFDQSMKAAQMTDFERSSREGFEQKETRSDVMRLITLSQERKWLPLIAFNFSRRECEGRALQCAQLDLLDSGEKDLVDDVYKQALESLSEEDRGLSQITTLRPLLRRGIGVHHSGLLPILKEVVEILFQEGLIKVLFATETFAMGVNMPARTVVFSSLQKFDGRIFRWITSGEYIQMSGRAGRRGKDEKGICILMADETLDEKVCRGIVKGEPDPLISRFKLSYNMILNLMRMDSVDPEYVIKRSLHQYQYEASLPRLTDAMEKYDKELIEAGFQGDLEGKIDHHYKMVYLVDELKDQLKEFFQEAKVCLPFLQPGRLVYIKDDKHDWGWSVVVSYRKRFSPAGFTVLVLVPCSKVKKIGKIFMPTPYKPNSKHYIEPPQGTKVMEPELHVVAFMTSMISSISSVRIYMPPDMRHPHVKKQVWAMYLEAKKQFPLGFPLVDPTAMGITDEKAMTTIQRIRNLEARIDQSPISQASDSSKAQYLELYQRKLNIQKKLQQMSKEAKKSLLTKFRGELKNRERILRRLGHVDADGVIQQKGRVAAEVESVDELVITELIFDGLFNTLSPPQVVAVLTCLFDIEKVNDRTAIDPDLVPAYTRLQEVAREVARISNECQIPVEEELYVASFKSSLMNVAYNWGKGKSFPEITKMTTMFEGSIIRIFRRLEEMLGQLHDASIAIGNKALCDKFDDALRCIKRGIMFTGSLYL